MKHIQYLGDDNMPLYSSTLGEGPSIIILHGGGPDRQSIIPFAKLLKNDYQVVFPDIRGYGESICLDRDKHNWQQYARDVISLMDHLDLKKTVICGMGLGSSIAERVAYSNPERVQATILISPETFDNDGEGSSKKEIELMNKCGEMAIQGGLEAAWNPFMGNLAPVIQSMVRAAFPRTDPRSFSAAMAIVHSQRLASWKQLSGIISPTLIIPGNDPRHNTDTGQQYLKFIPNATLGTGIDWQHIHTVDELAAAIIPQMKVFLKTLPFSHDR
ncbi:alpha/beta fold hydrolase [Negadavirga shengliensis]|uniref:Alpha/beta fold hydrolase n=1 Tax=Negadavirga shengliensis TaxID=1389218 RepID=A0ABV9T229_9BACT